MLVRLGHQFPAKLHLFNHKTIKYAQFIFSCQKAQVYALSASHAYTFSIQGILRLRGRPSVAYDQQGLVFAVAMEGGAIKLFDSRSYDKVCIKLESGNHISIKRWEFLSWKTKQLSGSI